MVRQYSLNIFDAFRPDFRVVGKAPAAGGATDQLNLLTRGRHGGMNVLGGGMAA